MFVNSFVLQRGVGKLNNDIFENNSIPKTYLKFAVPVVMSMLVSLIYNMVDTYFIALTGNTNLVAGISLMSPVFTLLVAFGDIWGLGGSSVISRFLGEKQYQKVKNTSAFSFWSAILFGVGISVIMILFRTNILHMLGVDHITLKYASDYYIWISTGAAAIIFGLVPSNLLRAEGIMMPTMIGSVLGSVANIILDPIFIFMLNHGAAGAAQATIVSNLIADIYYIFVILKKSKYLSIRISDVKLSKMISFGILTIGIPASITNIMQSFMVTITNHFLLSFGTDKIAAMGIALKVNMISVLLLVGFAFGGQPLIGYNYGSGNQKRLKETIKFAYILEISIAFALTVIMLMFAPKIIKIFMNDVQIIECGAKMLRYLQSSLVFMAIVLVTTCICQSFGKAIGAFILSISRQGIVYAVVIIVMSKIWGLQGVLISQAFADVIIAVIAVYIMKKLKER